MRRCRLIGPLLLFLLLSSALPAFAQGSINTVAGSDWVFTGAGGPATSAPLGLVQGVAVDSTGNVYVADSGNHRVFKISTAGTLTIIAGTGVASYSGDGGSATAAELNHPSGVAVDSSGNIYIADTDNAVVRLVSPGGTITTIAGNGSSGYSGDGGPATLAQLSSPGGVAVAASGKIYIADSANKIVRVLNTSGTIATLAGTPGVRGYSGDGGPATLAHLDYPTGVAVDASENVYIADTFNAAIRKVSAGVITTVAGTGVFGFSGDGGPATTAELNYPFGVAVDSSGNLYIADTDNLVIRKVSSGTINTIAGSGLLGFAGDGGPATSASLLLPYGVGVDSGGNVYIADTYNYRARKVVTAGTISTIGGNGLFRFAGDGGAATSAQLNLPTGTAIDSSGNLYVADEGNQRVRKVTPGGTITTIAGTGAVGFSGDGGPATLARLSYPLSVAVDSAGNVYVADRVNNRIRKISTGGTITTVAGDGTYSFSGDGGPATLAGLAFPSGLALDTAGNLYVADEDNHRIRKVDTSGVITTVAGNGSFGFSGDGGPATAAGLYSPFDVAVDAAGNLYIADTFNSRIRKVTAGGTISTIAGTGSFSYSGDGGPATLADISVPIAITIDSAGNVFFSDTGNERVRSISTSGIITTVAGDGSFGFSGDGGAATLAMLATPVGLAFDSSGNLYIADQDNYRVRKVAGLVVVGDFSLSVSPASASVAAGNAALYTVTIAASGGFSSAVTFSCSGLPSGASCGFGPNPAAPGTATLTVSTTTSTPLGSTSFTITGTAGSLTHTTTATLTVVATGTSQGTVSASAAQGAPGATAHIALSVTLNSGISLDGLSIGLQVNANGSAPALTGALTFVPAAGIPTPTLLDTGAGPNSIALSWLNLATPFTGTVALGEVIVNVPSTATDLQNYAIVIPGVSGSIGLNDVTLTPDANKTLTVVAITYVVGDTFPLASTAGDRNGDGVTDDAGEFGDGSVVNLDLVYGLRAVTSVPNYVPPACSDRYDAIDAFPLDTTSARGGDGALDNRDLIITLRRVVGIYTDKPQRQTRGLCAARGMPTAAEVMARASAGAEPEEPEEESRGTGRRLHPALQFGAPQPGQRPGTLRVAVYLRARGYLELMGFSFSAGIPDSGVPGEQARTVRLRFQPAEGRAPSIVDTLSRGLLAVAWLDELRIGAGQRALLGYLEVDSGTGAPPALLQVYGVVANALDDGRTLRVSFPAAVRLAPAGEQQ